jgi:hypothetical protein
METAASDGDLSLAAAGEDSTKPAHPAWRRFVAGAIAFVFALTLAAFGLLLCAA